MPDLNARHSIFPHTSPPSGGSILHKYTTKGNNDSLKSFRTSLRGWASSPDRKPMPVIFSNNATSPRLGEGAKVPRSEPYTDPGPEDREQDEGQLDSPLPPPRRRTNAAHLPSSPDPLCYSDDDDDDSDAEVHQPPIPTVPSLPTSKPKKDKSLITSTPSPRVLDRRPRNPLRQRVGPVLPFGFKVIAREPRGGRKRARPRPGDGFSGDEAKPVGGQWMVARKRKQHLAVLERQELELTQTGAGPGLGGKRGRNENEESGEDEGEVDRERQRDGRSSRLFSRDLGGEEEWGEARDQDQPAKLKTRRLEMDMATEVPPSVKSPSFQSPVKLNKDDRDLSVRKDDRATSTTTAAGKNELRDGPTAQSQTHPPAVVHSLPLSPPAIKTTGTGNQRRGISRAKTK